MILVVEDNKINQKVIRAMLHMAGHPAEFVDNGAEAVARFPDLKPSLILMDISMPVMNGHDATREIRRLEEDSPNHTPIIAVTAHVMKSDKELCFQAGMDDYVAKPITPQSLADIMSNWLDGPERSAAR